MRVLRPSRRRPRRGDVFALAMAENYLLGRVVSVTAKPGWSMSGANLIYVFRTKFSQLPDVPAGSALSPATELLVPPMMTNNLPWTRGYFQTIGSVPLTAEDVLPQHCFRSSTGKYFDEAANELAGAAEPCGD